MRFNLLNDINNSGCIIQDCFHMYCPGCGGIRAVKALLSGNFILPLYDNPIVILFIFMLIAILIIQIRGKIDLKKRKQYSISIVCAGILVIWFSFFVIRNYLLIYRGIDMLGDFIRFYKMRRALAYYVMAGFIIN